MVTKKNKLKISDLLKINEAFTDDDTRLLIRVKTRAQGMGKVSRVDDLLDKIEDSDQSSVLLRKLYDKMKLDSTIPDDVESLKQGSGMKTIPRPVDGNITALIDKWNALKDERDEFDKQIKAAKGRIIRAADVLKKRRMSGRETDEKIKGVQSRLEQDAPEEFSRSQIERTRGEKGQRWTTNNEKMKKLTFAKMGYKTLKGTIEKIIKGEYEAQWGYIFDRLRRIHVKFMGGDQEKNRTELIERIDYLIYVGEKFRNRNKSYWDVEDGLTLVSTMLADIPASPELRNKYMREIQAKWDT